MSRTGYGFTLLAALLVSGPALADDPPAEPDSPKVNPPAADPPAVPWAKRPANRRALVGLGSAASGAMGTAWYMTLGDQLGAGDPAGLMIGGGIVGFTGVVLGAAMAQVRRGEPLKAPLRTADVSIVLGSGAVAAAGETSPYTLGIEASPRVDVGAWSIRLSGALRSQLGTEQHVDPTTGAKALSIHTWGFDLDPQLALRLGDGPLELSWEAALWVRDDRWTYTDETTANTLRLAILPLNIGLSWWLTERDRLFVQLGPRWDHVALNGAATGTWFGPLYGRIAYEVHLPRLGAMHASRVRFAYTHSNFDGQGFNMGSIVGFAGPFELRYDMRFDLPRGPVGLQLGLIATLGDGGGVGVSFGIARREGRIR